MLFQVVLLLIVALWTFPVKCILEGLIWEEEMNGQTEILKVFRRNQGERSGGTYV